MTAPVFRELYELGSGSMRDGPEETTVAGQPALRYHGDEVIGGTRVESTRVQVFGTTEEILVTCCYTRTRAAEIRQGCAQILSTFAAESGSEHETARA